MKTKSLYLGAIQLLMVAPLCAQLQIKSGATLSVNGTAVVQLNNVGLINDGTLSPATGVINFTGNAATAQSTISGTATTQGVAGKSGRG